MYPGNPKRRKIEVQNQAVKQLLQEKKTLAEACRRCEEAIAVAGDDYAEIAVLHHELSDLHKKAATLCEKISDITAVQNHSVSYREEVEKDCENLQEIKGMARNAAELRRTAKNAINEQYKMAAEEYQEAQPDVYSLQVDADAAKGTLQELRARHAEVCEKFQKDCAAIRKVVAPQDISASLESTLNGRSSLFAWTQRSEPPSSGSQENSQSSGPFIGFEKK